MPDMPEAPYANREIQELFKAADDRADAFHDKLMERMSVFEGNTTDSLDRIETAVGVTNGRVKDLELTKARQEGFNKATTVFGAAAWAITFAFTSWVAFQVMDSAAQIKALNAKLSAYEVQVIE